MNRFIVLFVFAGFLWPAGRIHAQNHEHQVSPSPYSDFGQREIKALSAEEIEALVAGDGMGMALPAELNGFPGPKHVLEFSSELGLSDAERTTVERIYGDMNRTAIELGEYIVSLERQLDQAFASNTITAENLEEMLMDIGEARAELRTTHLKAHLKVHSALSTPQIRHYQMLRGYSATDH